MIFIPRDEPFICERCNFAVEPLTHGTCRSHCPKCLWSKHVDHEPGDRACSCHGLMEPISLDQSGKKGFVIIHKCTTCKIEKRNKAAPDDELGSIVSS
ncbi:MAG TPA: RNHCP domain-containing protein [Candidatus Peribacterales bacterium]|nr:RNHCP domain-containing protein [Candidatus Peribacterales bacterium]